MDWFFVIIVGLCIGSFLNVCIFRIPREESISFPPSHCMNCGYELKAKDLIPVISYIFVRGKCRNCGERISIQYPIIELFNGIMYALIYYRYGYSISSIKFMMLVSVMIVIGMIDLKTKFVYTMTTIFGGLLGIVFMAVDWTRLETFPKDNLYGMLLGGGIIALIVFITRGMGEGDIEIAAVAGLFLGLKATVFMLFLSFVLGGIVGILILILRKKGRKDEIPFGPYLAIGTMFSIFFGNIIIDLYLRNLLKI